MRQFILIKSIFATGSVDGSFGSGTATGLRHFQNLESITADGIVGSTTWGTFDKYASKGFSTRIHTLEILNELKCNFYVVQTSIS
nr:peptidoglycan-binding protein [Virgibacillus sp. MSJ-26]